MHIWLPYRSRPHARMHASIAQAINSQFFHWTPRLRGTPLSGSTHFRSHAITYHISLLVKNMLINHTFNLIQACNGARLQRTINQSCLGMWRREKETV